MATASAVIPDLISRSWPFAMSRRWRRFLGDKPFLMGGKPCAADAFVFGIVTSILTPPLDSPLRASMQQHANLIAYRDRITKKYFSAAGGQCCESEPSGSQLLRATDRA